MRWTTPLSALVVLGIVLGAVGSAVGLVDTTFVGELGPQSIATIAIVLVGMGAVVAVGVAYSGRLDSAHYW